MKKEMLLCWWWVVLLTCLTCCCLESVFASWTPHLQYLFCKIKCRPTPALSSFRRGMMKRQHTHWKDKWFILWSNAVHDDISGKSVRGSFVLSLILVNISKQNFKTQTEPGKRPRGIKRVDNLDDTHALTFWGYVCVCCGELMLLITVQVLLGCWAAAPGNCSPLSPGEAASPCAWSEETNPRP